jgi:hypothetical protein
MDRPFPVQWLLRRLAVDEVERTINNWVQTRLRWNEYLAMKGIDESSLEETQLAESSLPPWRSPFSSPFLEWIVAKNRHADDHEIWLYNTGDNSWKRRMGREGLVFLKDGKETANIVLMMN